MKKNKVTINEFKEIVKKIIKEEIKFDHKGQTPYNVRVKKAFSKYDNLQFKLFTKPEHGDWFEYDVKTKIDVGTAYDSDPDTRSTSDYKTHFIKLTILQRGYDKEFFSIYAQQTDYQTHQSITTNMMSKNIVIERDFMDVLERFIKDTQNYIKATPETVNKAIQNLNSVIKTK